MATKSFETEFKFNTKAGSKLINAIENSKKVNHVIYQRTENVTSKEDIDFIMDSLWDEDK
ncbi:hypothetical protein [Alkalicoccus chagannorensis]|uniref:hypothetical protein n=1 Tax=Alkalicoccus chagannorensis TaxID=427072 RepID=UPI00040A66AE|nr:hypothetical protein [Alkalicoccus chagannorensis]